MRHRINWAQSVAVLSLRRGCASILHAFPHPPPTCRTPPPENHPRGNASVGRARSPDLLLRLQVQPLDTDQCRSARARCAALRFRAGLCLHRLSVDDPNRAEACHDRLEPRQPPLPKRATRRRYRGTLTFGYPSNLEPTMINYRTPQVTPLVKAAGCYSKTNTDGFRL
jgi:hypothetical protein